MSRKNHLKETSAAGRPPMEGREILAAVREGTLTRGQFDAWHSTRRRSGRGFVIALRETCCASSGPFGRARRHKTR